MAEIDQRRTTIKVENQKVTKTNIKESLTLD